MNDDYLDDDVEFDEKDGEGFNLPDDIAKPHGTSHHSIKKEDEDEGFDEDEEDVFEGADDEDGFDEDDFSFRDDE